MTAQHFDVLIVGAGLSGIGAAHHLQERCPEKTYTILEGRDQLGGTWDLFRYPGIRSDSDMFTLGYSFKPWKSAKAIADGPAILSYLQETAQEAGIDRHIRYGHHVTSAEWSSADAHWTVTANNKATGDAVELTCAFLFMCSGYYNYAEGYNPTFAGQEDFRGDILQPQFWPEDLDYSGKRVVVIGSGATAVTLVPAMAEKAAHVTMLQRSPTYMVAQPQIDRVAGFLNKFLPIRLAHRLNRTKNVLLNIYFYGLCRRKPEKVKTKILDEIRKELGSDYDVEKHFSPSYNPWDQRMCLVVDGDMFEAIKEGKASVVTDHIKRFTESGVTLESGEQLEADVIVTATGLKLQLLSGVEFTVDGERKDLSESVTYKGMMFSGMPNMALVMGYTNASWTLKADLVSNYVCRLLRHMDSHNYQHCEPGQPDPDMGFAPFLNLTSGYVRRTMDQFPKQGTEKPWRLYQNYLRDSVALRFGRLDDGVMRFHTGKERTGEAKRDLAKAS